MVISPLVDDLRLAHVLADQADKISMARYRAQDLKIDRKPDFTPVSDADLAVEDQIRTTLARSRPRDAVHGEEREDTGYGERVWVIDPIDGTSNYVRGVPVWATLVALMENDQPVVGMVSAPALGRRWWASRGAGAFVGRSIVASQPCHVSKVRSLDDAYLSYSEVAEWVDAGLGQQFANLMATCWRSRGFGDFWNYMLVAEGAVDLAGEPELELHDMAACAIIVQEAGGMFTSIDGKPGVSGPGGLASNGLLHNQALAMLSADQ
ncbi:MAG: histidinol phosphatase [Propionibacteriaceae bacterium]|jgi:histidinol-phosphatase|nr:histidinol phosphatase [Propionibacteriaceae bacterium]